ncbi:hypothetical protein EUTSA_v10028862mg [Eutrema salsugineum]|uniref:Uncharacterized protein n=1 Tax=Eutrema salsugineum TaxID=72664 RepID=V4L752_EUTSA|nr:uncharacterized protein LOC18014774 [Eutrema salsugineum]ESQ38167.1 hypothetical protein EUTSA_v10028862mg [Eutrema salsugineum]
MTSSVYNSPEFEFWRDTNRSSTQPNVNLISADELFHDGILLPLHFLNLKPDPDPSPPASDPPASLIPEPESVPGPELTRETASKRWRGLFRKSENKPPVKNRKENMKREKKTGSGSGLTAAAELNINIWPFSRSRSAGNKLTRPRMSFGAPKTRKISSAPCSRSNSAGESKSRKWPNSPVRGGVHLGRSSPVWQVRRVDPTGKPMSGWVGERTMGKMEIREVRRGKTVKEDNKPKVLSLNAPVCTGSRSRLSCRDDENGSGNSNVAAASSANSLFGFRNLFIKKVY